MPISHTIEQSLFHDFWDGLAEFGPARTEAALDFTLRTLVDLVDAQQAFWLGTVRLSHRATDPVNGWRPAVIRYLHPQAQLDKHLDRHMQRINRGDIDTSIVAHFSMAGAYRITTQHELVAPEWWQSDFHADFYAPVGIRDVLFLIHPIGEDIESWFGVWRIGELAQPFDASDKQRLDGAMRSLKWLHRRLALHYGLHITENPLTATERDLLEHLLGKKTEADIARTLGLSASTVHTYATRIYKKFNVQGRIGLAALWLGK